MTFRDVATYSGVLKSMIVQICLENLSLNKILRMPFSFINVIFPNGAKAGKTLFILLWVAEENSD